jgi:hypothetical protein
MSWSEDFVKLLQSLPTAIKTTKCQSSLSTPCRCSSRYPYTGTLGRCHYTIVNPYFSVQPSSIGRCTTMGEVWHHDSISTKRYWHLMSCTPVDIYILSIFVHLSCTWACRSYSSLLSLFSCLSFSLSLNSPTPTYVTVYPLTCQYWVVKCNLSEALLYCYVLLTSGWQAVTWCPAGVIFNSRLDST